MMQDKDWNTAISYIAEQVDKAICVEGFAPKTVAADKLAAVFADGITSDIESAVSKAIELAGTDGMVIVAGSLYLASAIQNRKE